MGGGAGPGRASRCLATARRVGRGLGPGAGLGVARRHRGLWFCPGRHRANSGSVSGGTAGSCSVPGGTAGSGSVPGGAGRGLQHRTPGPLSPLTACPLPSRAGPPAAGPGGRGPSGGCHGAGVKPSLPPGAELRPLWSISLNKHLPRAGVWGPLSQVPRQVLGAGEALARGLQCGGGTIGQHFTPPSPPSHRR